MNINSGCGEESNVRESGGWVRYTDDVMWEVFTQNEVCGWIVWVRVLSTLIQCLSMLFVVTWITTMFNKGLGEDYGATQGGGTGGAQMVHVRVENEHDYIEERNIDNLSEEEEKEEAVNDGLGAGHLRTIISYLKFDL